MNWLEYSQDLANVERALPFCCQHFLQNIKSQIVLALVNHFLNTTHISWFPTICQAIQNLSSFLLSIFTVLNISHPPKIVLAAMSCSTS